MSNNKLNSPDYIRFYLIGENKKPIKVNNMIGWNEFGLSYSRNLDYHGTLTSVASDLGFTGIEKKYILDEYSENGILAKMILAVEELEEFEGVLQWVRKENIICDYNEKNTKDGILNISFYSNKIQSKIDAYEDQDFEIESLISVENKELELVEKNIVDLEGRSITNTGYSEFVLDQELVILEQDLIQFDFFSAISLTTNVVSKGPFRHTAISDNFLWNPSISGQNSTNFFYTNSVEEIVNDKVIVNIEIKKALFLSNLDTRLSILKYSYNENTAKFDFVQEYIMVNIPKIIGYSGGFSDGYTATENISIRLELDILYNESLTFAYVKDEGQKGVLSSKILEKSTLQISSVPFFEKSPGIEFMFVHDVIQRLMLLITGQEDSFYSSYLGRLEKSYKEDGEGGLIGFVSGLQSRGFTTKNDKYKSPQISLKDALQSVHNCFCLGSGVETYKNVERLVTEKVEYFYRQEVVGRFPEKISNEEEYVDSKMFYSSFHFGYEKVQALDQEMGLDEPNVKSSFVGPIDTSIHKFTKYSKIRADEYKLETLRRKTALEFPDEKLSGDDDNWFLDLKRKTDNLDLFEQTHWSDRLEEEPKGIHDPNSFRSMFFTPFRMLLRNSVVFNSGMYLFGEKFVNFTSSLSNRNLSMKFIGEKEYKESDNIIISDLKLPLFTNNIIKFNHPNSLLLQKMIRGKTSVLINGEERLVPNFLFKYEFLSSEDELLRGHFLKYEHSDNPTFTFLLSQ